MLCAISGEAPQVPVASRKSGNVFEKRLIESYIQANGTDPVNGEELSVDDLVELKQSRTVRPRPPTLTSIPALLSAFQNEWDALVLETFQLKQQLAETRQELSTALYYSDSAEKVIARLQRERDEARDALSKVSVTSNGATNGDADAMQVDGHGLPEHLVTRIEETQAQLSSTRRKRAVPADWATADTLQALDAAPSSKPLFPGGRCIAVDQSGELALVGGANGSAGVYSISQGQLLYELPCVSGTVTDGLWYDNKAVVALSTGAIKVFDHANEIVSFDKHAGAATAVSLHPCGDILASVGVDKSYILYDLATRTIATQVFTDSELTTAAFHPDGHLLAAGSASGSIKLFDVKTGENAANFDSSAQTPVQAISFSENGTWLASALKGSSSVSIWDLRKMAEIKVLDMGTAVDGVSWDYSAQFLAVCGQGFVAVQQYSKSSKSWSEPFRKALTVVDVKWGPRAQSLVALNSEGGVTVLTS